MVSKYIQQRLPANYKVACPNSYVDNISTEFDLLIVRAQAQPTGAGYEPSDVQVILEIKTAGIPVPKARYPQEIEKVREKFDEAKRKNSRIWGALLMCYGTIHPKRETSINYEGMRKEKLEPYGYGVYTLADSRMVEWGKWEKFIKDLLSKLG